MPAILTELIAAGVTVATCLCVGSLILRWFKLAPSGALAFLCGSAVASLAVLLLSLAGWIPPWMFVVFAVAAAASRWRWGTTGKRPVGDRPHMLIRAVVFVFGAIYFIHALAPEASADGSWYHLGLVRLYLERGAMYPDPSMLASFPQGMEMLFLMAYALAKLLHASPGAAGAAAALVHLSFLAALVKLLFDAGRRAGFPAAGYAAGLVMLASPVVGIDAASAYNDVALAAVVFGSFVCISLGSWAAAGLLAGFAFGIKYTAISIVLWVLGFAAWKTRSVRIVTVTAVCATVMIAPWLIRNSIWRGNPVAPFLNRVFPNPHQYVSVEDEFRNNMATFNEGRIDLSWPAEVTFRSRKLQSVTGVAFLLAPLGLLAIRRPMGAGLLLCAATMLVTYPSNLLTRFLIPALPLVAFAIALALSKWRPVLALWAAAQVILALPWVPLYSGWRIAEIPWRAALRLESEDDYARRQIGYTYDLARLIESRVPHGGIVYTALPLPDAYAGREIVLNYTSALGNRLYEVLYAVAKPETRLRLSVDSPTRLRCTTCGSMGRIYEAPNGVRVFANRWDAGLLSDGNLATFWSPWGAGLTEIETPRGDLLVSAGNWNAAAKATSETPAPADATNYFREAGITHLVIHDDEGAGPLIRANPMAWSMREIGAAGPARLYEITALR